MKNIKLLGKIKMKKQLKIAMLAVLLGSISTMTSAIANTLENISFSSLTGDQIQIVIKTTEPVENFRHFTTDGPARIAIDLPSTTSALAKKTQIIGTGVARSVTAVGVKGRTRVVVNLLDSVPFEITQKGNLLYVDINTEAKASSQNEVEAVGALITSAPTPTAQSMASHDNASEHAVKKIDFRRGTDGEGRVVIVLSDPKVAIDMRQQGEMVILDFLDTSIEEAMALVLDVADFATPVAEIETHAIGNNVRMTISTLGEYEHLAYQANSVYTLEFRSLTKQEKERKRKELNIYEGDRLSLNFQDIEVRSVLQLLADFTGLNMVVSDTVTGRITLRLKNVPWDQAMDIILKTKGLSKRVNDNVILVAPTEEIAAREKLELESQKQIEELAPLRSELVQINYAKAADVATLLKSEENKLLSPRGAVTVDARTNTLLINDTSAKLAEVRQLIKQLDIPVRQVLIEARIVVANDDFAKDLGVRVGFGASGTSNGGGTNVLLGGGVSGSSPAGNPVFIDGSNVGNQTLVGGVANQDAITGVQDLLVNLPVAAASGGVNLLIGKLGEYLLRLELTAMQQEGKGEIISSPRVITSDQHKAVISEGVEIPYLESAENGGTTVAFKEAVLRLEVTPHITPDNKVIMELNVSQDTPDFANVLVGGAPPIDTRSVQTKVLVDNGETVVLGGVFVKNKSTSSQRIPFFGDLPYVGFLFKQKLVIDNNQELLIFITPKILKDSLKNY